MNATNMGNDPEADFESKESNATDMEHILETNDEEGNLLNRHHELCNTPTHRYNLWPRPTKQQERLNLMQIVQQSTYAEYRKLHLHIMTQMSVKAGIKNLGKREMMW